MKQQFKITCFYSIICISLGQVIFKGHPETRSHSTHRNGMAREHVNNVSHEMWRTQLQIKKKDLGIVRMTLVSDLGIVLRSVAEHMEMS